MPAHDRDRQVREEANVFCSNKSSFPGSCQHHKPTLEEIQSTTFSDYVRNVVLQKAEPIYVDESDDDEEEGGNSNGKLPGSLQPIRCKYDPDQGKVPYRFGMAKVTLPKGFCKDPVDASGRDATWESGTPLGDHELPSPMQQCLRGIGGIYEYTFMDKPSTTAADFRKEADAYLKSQTGSRSMDDIDSIERKFWKRLTPTMTPAMYGADMEGTLFASDDDCCGWNISKLNSCLELLCSDLPHDHKGGIPGVTTPYLYFGMWASVFCAHTEDMDLLSINYLHAGSPKVWYSVAAGEDAKRLEQLAEGHYPHAKSQCAEFLRHKRSLISPLILKKAGIVFTRAVQYPGDAMITFPGSYHFGFNTGFNVAEATNFAVPEWIPYGKQAEICLCRPDSVRFDMGKFERLLIQYESEVKQSKRLTWRDWANRIRNKRNVHSSHYSHTDRTGSPSSPKKEAETKDSSRKALWVEVMQPVASKGGAKSQTRTGKSKSRKRNKKKEEIWHLAKTGSRRSLVRGTRVLCIMPAEADVLVSTESSDEEEEDEQCFAASIVELSGDHARVHFDGLSKKEDVWMQIESPKLFLDGGRWVETDAAGELPPKHYWKVDDSKRRCI